MRTSSIEIPHADPLGTFVDRSGCIGTNPTELAGPDRTMDEAAAFSVLQFGAIVPPLSPWREVKRLVPGFRYPPSGPAEPIPLEYSLNIQDLDVEGQASEIETFLDRQLTKAVGDEPDPILLFSGGVDSGLIAVRLVELGYKDTLLVNHSFGEDDPEALLAESMAQHLGLRFERLDATHEHRECLERPGSIYPQPFGNRATIATLDLPYEIIERFSGENRPILDGRGADGAFGMSDKINPWLRLLSTPRFLRMAGASMYELGLWRRQGALEHLLRTVRRSVTMPPLSAILALNPLDDIFYDTASAEAVHRSLAEWIEGWGIESFPHQVVAADLALVSVGRYAPGTQAIYTNAGLDVRYPFLDSEGVGLALAAYGFWGLDQNKAALKCALARHVPSTMVYRTKSAYRDPLERIFFDPVFIDYLREAAEPSSPIASLVRSRPVIKACDLLSRGNDLPLQTRSCLWSIMFVDRWYRTAGQDHGTQ